MGFRTYRRDVKINLNTNLQCYKPDTFQEKEKIRQNLANFWSKMAQNSNFLKNHSSAIQLPKPTVCG